MTTLDELLRDAIREKLIADSDGPYEITGGLIEQKMIVLARKLVGLLGEQEGKG